MKFVRYIAISLAGLSCAYFIIILFYDMFAIARIVELGFDSVGSLELRLYFLHLVLAALTCGLLCSWRIKSQIRKYVALTACIGILAVYVMWFLEKYSFLKEGWGLKEGSADYELYLSEFGMLRGATSADYLFSVVALASVTLVLGLILATSIWKTDQP
jgi:hypothetical protein